MKKYIIFCFLIVSLLITLPINQVLADSATLSLSPATGTFNKGCNFQVNINVNTGGVQTGGTDVILMYDQTRFKATRITSGTIYSDYPTNSIDEASGKIQVSGLSSISSAFSGQGVLATVDFTVLPEAPEGVSKVKFDFDPNDKGKTTDSNIVERGTAADILSQVTDGNFIVGTGSCTGGVVTPVITSPIGTGSDSGIITQTPIVPTKTPVLVESADFNTTLTVAAAGIILIGIAALGLAIF